MTTDGSLLGLVLAGGRSTRMGGGEKPLRPLAGRCLIDHVLDRLRPQVGSLAVSANGDVAAYSARGLPVLRDEDPGRLGPLAGILAGLRHAAGRPDVRALLSVPGDTPFLPADLAARLVAAGSGGLAVAASASGDHPTVALWPVVLESDLAAFLRDGGRRVRDFAARHGASTAAFPQLAMAGRTVDPFFNVNTPDDLAAVEALLTGAGEGAP